MTKEEYDLLPGTGAAMLLNAKGDDGQPIIKFAKGRFTDGRLAITRYWINEKGESWRRTEEFIATNDLIDNQ